MGSALAFEAQAGKRMTLLEWGQDWYECNSGDPRRCGMTRFPAGLAARVRAHGALPVLSWGSYAGGRGSEQPAYRLAEIIAGRYDRSILAWARAAAAWRHPFFLRFDWEMNTNEVPYSEHANGNRAGEFVRMWRHVHALFVRAGATNAIWVWCPNVEYPGSVMPLRALYPGNRYVDWVGLDGYNWGTDRGRWQTPAEVFGATYDRLTRRIAPSKPVMIGETASSEHGGSKAHWIADLLRRQLPRRFPRVRAVVWFNKSADGIDWPISTSAAAVRAFRRAIASPRYAGRRLR
jgi:beta-mannanase